MSGIVHDHIKSALRRDDLGDAGVDRRLRTDIEFDGPQVDAIVLGVCFDVSDLGRIAATRLAHRGVYRVTGASEDVCREATKPT